MKRLTIEQVQEKINSGFPKDDLTVISYETRTKDAVVKCNKCGQLITKKGMYFLDTRKVSICKNCNPTQPNQKKDDFKLPEGYSYIDKYNGMHNKIKIRHDECGFIWEVKPNNLKYGKGCPKCSKKISKGEKRIIDWLDDKNINYIFQYPVNIGEYKLTMDFYLPDLDLYIEYNGEQHYHPIEHFGGKEKFEKQLLWDKAKKDFYKDKLLVISYLDFNNIDKILETSTTISKESTL